jgi:hypothetical protein
MTEYNKPIKEVKSTPLPADKQYRSVLARTVPFVSKPSEWYQDKSNWNLCNWCKVEERVKTKFGLISWCQRCYDLHAVRHDGTVVQQSTLPIAQDLADVQQGKVKIIPELQVERKVYNDD